MSGEKKAAENCKICRSPAQPAFEALILEKYPATYFKCDHCGFLWASSPEQWLSEAYETPITEADKGLLARNISFSRKIAVLIDAFLPVDGNFLDYAGGYGVFTRLMRDIGFRFYHMEPYTPNIFAKGLEWDKQTKIDGITCLECIEHLPEPMETFREIFSIAKVAFVSTKLLPSSGVVPDKSWSYYGFEHGQHISFYSIETLKFIADRFGLHLCSVGDLHFFSPFPVKRKRMKWLISKSDRLPFPCARHTLFQRVRKKMKKRRQKEADRQDG